jgi:hypothetical protein
MLDVFDKGHVLTALLRIILLPDRLAVLQRPSPGASVGDTGLTNFGSFDTFFGYAGPLAQLVEQLTLNQ